MSSSRLRQSGAPRSRLWKKNRSSLTPTAREPIPSAVADLHVVRTLTPKSASPWPALTSRSAILGFIILAIWHAVGEPGSARVGRVFRGLAAHSLRARPPDGELGGHLAAGDRVSRHARCKACSVCCVPFTRCYYMLSRWRETRGIFAMCFAPLVVLILLRLVRRVCDRLERADDLF